MNKYDKVFLKQARLGYSKFLSHYHRKSQEEDLRDRKHALNKEFVFSEENVNRLSHINKLLADKSKDAYEMAEKLESYILPGMKDPDTFISDYEIEFEVCFFAEKKYSHIPDLQGNPFFECQPIWFSKADRKEAECKEHKDWLFNTDHTEVFQGRQQLSSFKHSYLFHDLIDHTILSYQDIADIEDIWIEVVLTVQNFQEIPPRRL